MDLVKSTSKVFIAKTAGSVITFAGITFFAREIGAFQMGVFFLFQALLGIISVPADLGIRGALEKRISGAGEPGQILATGAILKLIILLTTVGFLLLFRTKINEYIGINVAAYLVVGLIFQEINLLFVHTLNGELRVGETAALLFIWKFGWVSVGFVLVILGLEARALIIGFTLGHFVALILGAKRVSIRPKKPSLNAAKSIYHYAKFDVVSSAGSRFYGWLDVVVIGYFLTQDLVGAYETAWKLSGVTILFVQSIRTTIFPKISSLEKVQNYDQIEKIISNTITPALFLVIPSFFGLLLLSRDVLRLIFGPEFAVAWVVLIVFMIQKMVQSINDIVGRSLQAVDYPNLAAYAMLIGIAANVILNIVLVATFGIIGAAFATLVSHMTMVILRYVYLSRIVTIRIPYLELGWCVIASIGMLLILLVYSSVVSINSIPTLSAAVLLGVVSYFTFIMIYPPLRYKIKSGFIRIS